MARSFPIPVNLERGFKRDAPRDEWGVYKMIDWIPSEMYAGPFGGVVAPVYKRGGTAYATPNLNSVSACSSIVAVIWAAFGASDAAASPQLLTVASNNKLFYQSSPTSIATATLLGTLPAGATYGSHPPIWHRDTAIFLPSKNVALPLFPQKVTMAGAVLTLATLGGTPPKASVGASWGDYLILANGSLGGTYNARRAWWSDVGNADAWTTAALAAGSFWDFPDEITAVAPTKNGIMFFGHQDLWVLVGDIPPPGGNLTRRDLAPGIGCTDARSVARHQDLVLWANSSGIWKSDGATYPVNITDQAGVSSWWRAALSGYGLTNDLWSIAGGVWGGNYVCTVFDGSSSYKTLVIDLNTLAVTEFTNIKAAMYASRSAGVGHLGVLGEEQLFIAHNATPRAEKLAGCWTGVDPEGASNVPYQDADSTAIKPRLGTGFFRLGVDGRKRFRRAFITYDIAAGNITSTPALTVKYDTDPNESNLRTGDTLAFSPTRKRTSARIATTGDGVLLDFSITTDSGLIRLYGIEIDAHAFDQGRK